MKRNRLFLDVDVLINVGLHITIPYSFVRPSFLPYSDVNGKEGQGFVRRHSVPLHVYRIICVCLEI